MLLIDLWIVAVHESSVGLSSTTNPKPRGKPTMAMMFQVCDCIV